MKQIILVIVLGIIVFSCISEEKQGKEIELNEEVTDVVFDSLLAKKYKADDYGMKKYVMAFLRRGPNRDRSEEESKKLQAAHMENIGKMAEAGKLVLAGPFFGDGDLRGIYIFDVEDLDEAKRMTESDPAIQAGSLEMELIEWYGSAALMGVRELHKSIAKIEI